MLEGVEFDEPHVRDHAGAALPAGGLRRCAPGYFEFIKNVLSKQKRLRDHAIVWYGGPYDPDDIDEQKIVRALGKIAGGRAKR